MAERTPASGFTRDILPRRVVSETRRRRDAEIARDSAPYGPADDPMLPVSAGDGEGMGAAVWGVAFVVLAIVVPAVLCMLAEAC